MPDPHNSDESPASETAQDSRQSSAIWMGSGARQDMVTCRGGEIAAHENGEAGPPAFVHVAPRMMPLPVLIAVPHAGRTYPTPVLDDMRDAQLSTIRLEDRHVDALGAHIAQDTGTGLLVAHAPRAMLDLNRASEDVDWDMVAPDDDEGARRRIEAKRNRPRGTNARARSGLGLVPRRLSGHGEIWRSRISEQELVRRVDRIHRPYHSFLAQELERIRDIWGAVLLIDLHSMPPLRKRKGEGPTPRFVLGDRFGSSCSPAIMARALRFLDEQGVMAAHNRPYAGGYVLDRHGSQKRGIHAIQLEVCRSTYLDDALDQLTRGLKPLAQMLAGLVREVGAETARIGAEGGQGGHSGFAQAAE